jgi:hypothetical protein
MAKRIPYQLVIKERKGYLYVEYGGVGLTLQAILDMIHLSAQAVRTLQAKRVLLVRNIPLFTSDIDRTMLASIIKRVIPPDVRFAMVDKYGNDPIASQQGLAVLRAAGWDVTEFKTANEAETWLAAD